MFAVQYKVMNVADNHSTNSQRQRIESGSGSSTSDEVETDYVHGKLF